MTYTDLVFDLYGTLVDIHTEESDEVWEKTALYFGYYGAHYTGETLKAAFAAAMAARETRAGQSYECFPDIPFEQVMAELFRARGVTENADALGVNAAQLFRIASTEYLRLYPGVPEALAALRKKYAATTSQVLAGFFFTRVCPMLPLFGCSSEEHLAELIAAVDIPFTPEDYRLPVDE